MIKIERMSEDCKANVNGGPIFVGMILTHEDIKTLEVLSGKVMYSVDENELVDVEATQLKVEVKAPAKK